MKSIFKKGFAVLFFSCLLFLVFGSHETVSAISRSARYLNAPSQLSVKQYEHNYARITYDSVENATSYEIYKRVSGQDNYRLVKSTTARAVIDKTLKKNQTTYYYIRAVNQTDGYTIRSSATNVAKITITDTYVHTPTPFSLYRNGGGIQLIFTPSEGVSQYIIYRKNPGDDSFQKYKATTSTSYLDKNVKSGSTYSYYVKAMRNVGDKSYYSKRTPIISGTAKKVSSSEASIQSKVSFSLSRMIKISNAAKLTSSMTQAERAGRLAFAVSDYMLYGYDMMQYFQVHDYNIMSAYNSTAWYALKYRKGMCGNYANLVQDMMGMNGIDCKIMSGDYEGTSHMWNILKLDGTWYVLDITGNTPSTTTVLFYQCSSWPAKGSGLPVPDASSKSSYKNVIGSSNLRCSRLNTYGKLSRNVFKITTY